jgi:hypothetical protein
MLRKTLVVLVALLALVACSKKELKPQSEDSKVAVEAFSAAEGMRKAYVAKDFEALRQYATEAGYSFIERRLGDFDKAELEFTNRWVEIEGDRVTLNVSWRGTWTVGGDERGGRGMAVFQFQGRPLRLERIHRANPFSVPE